MPQTELAATKKCDAKKRLKTSYTQLVPDRCLKYNLIV